MTISRQSYDQFFSQKPSFEAYFLPAITVLVWVRFWFIYRQHNWSYLLWEFNHNSFRLDASSQLLIRKYIIDIDVTWLVLWAWEYVSPLLKTPILANPLRMCWKNGEIRVQMRPNTACPCWNSIAKKFKREKRRKRENFNSYFISSSNYFH